MLSKTVRAIGIGLFSLATALPISAQETATLALRNGERPSGQLIDMNASGFILRVNGQDRTIPAGEVSAVEFVAEPLPAAALAKVNAGQAIILMRNGQILDGRLSDVGGTNPLRLTVDTPSGQREFTSNEVAQAVIAPMSHAAATPTATTGAVSQPAPAPVPAGAITVPANQQWTNTGIPVIRGQRFTFSVRGDVHISPTVTSGPDGNPSVANPNARYPVRGAAPGALIGRVGNGEPFPIGSNSQPITMPANGPLMLGVNDDIVNDNSDAFYVNIANADPNRRVR